MEDQGPTILAVMWSLTVLALVLVVARLCVRQRIIRNFGLDDWLIAFSMVSSTGFLVFFLFKYCPLAPYFERN
jgi:hypothetical protein